MRPASEEHLHSIVLDALFGTPDLDPFAYAHYRTQAMPRAVRLDSLRSPTCSSDHPDPDTELSLLIAAIRLHPIEGNGYDASGNVVHVDEDAVLNYIVAKPERQLCQRG